LRALVRDVFDFDRASLLILAYVPLALTVLEYVFVRPAIGGRISIAPEWVMGFLKSFGKDHPSIPPGLLPWLWWAAGCVVFLLVVPMALVRLGAGLRPRDTGLLVRGTGRDAIVYAILFVVFIPVVYLVSKRGDFSQTYPFYPRPAPYGPPQKVGGDWLVFEAAYFLQFLSVEYFFRGFMVLGLKPALGRASILVMLAPYCMIHYHKPMLEAFGAIGAGVVLGCLSYRTRTVIYGWFLHYAVALSMDLLSLSQSGRL